MKYPYLVFLALTSSGCPVASAYDINEEPACVIDQCSEKTCSVETPEGWVDVNKKPEYHEGKKIACPVWLIEPT